MKAKEYHKAILLTLYYPFWTCNDFSFSPVSEHTPDKLDYFLNRTKIEPLFLLKASLSCYYDGNPGEMAYWTRQFDSFMGKDKAMITEQSKLAYLYLFNKSLHPSFTPMKLLDLWKTCKIHASYFPNYPLTLLTQNKASFLRGGIDFSSQIGNIKQYIKMFYTASCFVLGEFRIIFCDLLCAEAAFEQNRQSTAFEFIHQAVKTCQIIYDIHLYFIVMCQKSQIHFAINQKTLAFETLRKLQEAIQSAKANDLLDNYQAFYTRMQLLNQDENAAHLWLERLPEQKKAKNILDMPQYFTTLYALQFLKRYEEGIPFLESLIVLCENFNRTLDLAEAYLLKSLFYFNSNKKEEILYLKPLYHAVILAQKIKGIQIFMNKKQMPGLLERLLASVSLYLFSDVQTSFVKQVISLYKQQTGCRKNVISEIKYIKLSNQQKEMLLFLAKGFSYNEISQTTGLKITTIRTHITKLYQKLNVTNKKDALLRAGELGFFDL